MSTSIAEPGLLGSTPRTRVRRLPEKAAAEREALHQVLDAGLVAHVAVVDDSGPGGTPQPYVLPVAYARFGEHVLFHGSTGSRLFRTLAAGAPTCLTVTLLDGLVLARSAFESSMNYRGAMVLGTCAVLGGGEKEAALERISEHLMPGRWAEIRPPSRKELAATVVLELSLAEASVKISDGGPTDEDEDLELPVWAGVVPLAETWCDAVPSADLRAGLDVPDYVRSWRR
jgi:nitroimidazol reductase NimA-like FMN-containing flavoprotein (pyridoxamine 5'-phosphate oxidase superfamily)